MTAEPRYYSDIGDFKELENPTDVTLHVKAGWELLKIIEKHTSQVTEKGVALSTFIIYVMELPRSVTPKLQEEPVKTSPPTPEQLYDRVRAALGADFDSHIHIKNYGRTVKMDYSPDRSKWERVNKALKALGYRWISAGKDSHWEKEGA